MTDRVYNLLRGQIIDLDLEPGTRLQIEGLSAGFDVSPTPVREALNRLTAEGLVTQEPYRGFRVSDLLDPVELAQLLHARELIESAAVVLTARTRDDVVLRELERLVRHMDELASADSLDLKEFNAADAEFHKLTVSASGNRFLLEALEALHVHVQIARHYHGRSPAEARRSNEDHRRLLAAIEGGDSAEAVSQVSIHIFRVLDRLEPNVSDKESGTP